MGIALLIVCIGYLILAAIIFFITKKLVKSKVIVVLVALVLILYPFRRVIFYQTLFYFYNRAPLQEIHQTVESPESVYWEDNVWPGFDEYGRHWMVKNYLDGVHLKVLALNGDDGNIYLYRATSEVFAESKKLLSEVERGEKAYKEIHAEAKKSGTGKYDPLWVKSREVRDSANALRWQHYDPQKDREVEIIRSRAERYGSKKDLPPMRFRVEFNLLPKSLVINNDFDMLHADRISIIDEKSNQEIAYSQRYMAHAGFISKFSGEQPDYDYTLGDTQPYEFDNRVLFEYAGVSSSYEAKRSRLEK